MDPQGRGAASGWEYVKGLAAAGAQGECGGTMWLHQLWGGAAVQRRAVGGLARALIRWRELPQEVEANTVPARRLMPLLPPHSRCRLQRSWRGRT